MLNMSGRSMASATALRLTARCPWEVPDQEVPGGSHVWALRPAWAVIVQAALGLGPVTVRAGDGLCGIEHRAHLRWLGSAAAEGQAQAGAWLSIEATGWACGMATQARLNNGRVRRGLAFFDGGGHSVLKLDLADDASADGVHEIVRRFGAGTGRAGSWDGWASVNSSALQRQPPVRGLLRRLQAEGRLHGELDQLAGKDLAQPLDCDALLEVMHHARQSRLPMSVRFAGHGLRLGWSGHLLHLEGLFGVAIASGFDIELQWSESPAQLQAWLLREPTARGLSQSLALLAPDGELRLTLAPLHAPERPEPCAWRSAISAVCGGHCGSAC